MHLRWRRYPLSRIEVRSDPGLPAVLGDEAAIELAVVNLISNALKYGREDGIVHITIVKAGGEVVIRVLDEGLGLPDGDPARLFDLFYRDKEAQRRAAGAGIGLYVARALIEGVGGQIWAANRPGGGAEFGIALPIVPEPADFAD